MSKEFYHVTTKSLVPMCILRILKDHSNKDHKLTQAEIKKYLETEYDITSERKAIARNINSLKEDLGIGISSDRKGAWYEDANDFSDAELHTLVDSIFACRYLSEADTKKLIDKLSNLGSEFFRPSIKYTVFTDKLGKVENHAVFTNIEYVDMALAKQCRLQFNYSKLGPDKKWRNPKEHTVSPLRLVVHGGRYYLMAFDEDHQHITNYRIERISDVKLLEDVKATRARDIKGLEAGLDSKMGTNLPYMFSDKEERISFYVNSNISEQMFDWLGMKNVIIDKAPLEDGRIKMTVNSSPMAFKFFALQYAGEMEVVSPASLREAIYKSLKNAAKKYK